MQMAISKVVYGTTILVDLTADTVKASVLSEGYTAHGANGELISGAMSVSTLHTGSGEPSSGLGTDGDIYIQL